MQSSGSGAQLDQLLLKAESYSHFILENQKRTQALQKTRLDGDSAEAKLSASNGFSQPPNLVGGTLMPYQLEGLQWLLSLWENGLNGILADEMGLGKTIQIISLIAHLRHNNTAGPYLIAGPLATITNWVKEFKKWLPSCPVILYHGTRVEREALRKKHMLSSRSKELDFPIVITSFEMCIADRAFLELYVWQYIILDEGHRIKNRNCRLIKELKSIRSVSRLLLTGTPIQNSLEELWSLLNFCSPMIFDDLEVFQSWFDFKNIGQDTQVEDILSTEEQDRIVTKMHEILRPFVLRRLKKEVLGSRLPPKVEVVVYCGMSGLQSEYYAQVLAGTLRESLVDVGVIGASKISQINQTMNLRKVCNHPFLFGDLTDGVSGESLRNAPDGRALTFASGKFKLLDRMLPRLKREGSKVLIFSQMTKLMDILEDYLVARDHSYVRFDGSTKLSDRQASIDEFNRKDSGVFAFLLSTRAGGLGINLTAADTVILFDSDWNPHQDSQAQDRCHRIGQSRRVVTYRFLTSGSVEIDMMKKQMSKKKLERLTMQGGDYRKAGRREGQQQVSLGELRALLEDDVKNLHRREQQQQQHRADAPKQENAENVKMNGNSSVSAVDWIQRDISEAELDLIMDRTKLFPEYRAHKEFIALSSPPPTVSSSVDTATTSASCRSNKKRKSTASGAAEEESSAGDVVVLDYRDYNEAVSAALSPVKTEPAANSSKSTSKKAINSATSTPSSSVHQVISGADDVVDVVDGVDAALVAIWDSERKAAESAGVQGVVPLEGEMYDIIPESRAAQVLLSLN